MPSPRDPRERTMTLIAASVMMQLGRAARCQCLGLFLPPMTQALAMSASDFTFAIAVQNIVLGGG